MNIEKKYYATNIKALSFGECMRLGGSIPMGILSWIMGRFLPPQGRDLMPINFDEVEAAIDDLSELLQERISKLSQGFLNCGFKIIAYQKIPSGALGTIDSGGCVLLSSDRKVIGTVNILISQNGSNAIQYKEALAVGCFDSKNNSIGVQTTPGMDSKKGSCTVVKKGATVEVLLRELEKRLKKWKLPLLQFTDWIDVRPVLQKM
jgi:hypothetical protein